MNSKLLTQLAEVRKLPVITLGTLAESLKDQGILVLCLIVILPFMQPIPIPGLSTILGFVALLQGVSLMFLKKPLLTKKMKEVVISADKFEMIYKGAEKFTRLAGKISIVSHHWASSNASRFIGGLAIVLSAAFLSLPLPIPLSNFIPALSIAFICLGLLEEDPFLVIIGLSITVAVMWMGAFSFHFIVEKFPQFFN